MIHHLLDAAYLLTTYGYVGVFLVVFLESGVIFALPGDSLLFTAGLLASVAGLNLFLLIPLIFIAGFAGSIAGYYIGHYLDSLRRYSLVNKVIRPDYVAAAHAFFEKHGRFALIASRFVPVMRTFTPIVAGVARMPKAAFVRYSLLSSLLWSASITLLGYFLGQAFPHIKDYLSYFIIGIVVVSLLPGIVHYLRTRRQQSRTR